MNTNMKINTPRFAIAPIDFKTVSSRARSPGKLLTILKILRSLNPLSTTKLGPIFKKSKMEKKLTTVSKQLNPSLKYYLKPREASLNAPSVKKISEKISFVIF